MAILGEVLLDKSGASLYCLGVHTDLHGFGYHGARGGSYSGVKINDMITHHIEMSSGTSPKLAASHVSLGC